MDTNSLADLQGLAQLHTQYIGSTSVLDQNSPATTNTSEAALYVRRPWLDPPPGFLPFDEQNGIALPGLGGADTVVLQFQVPDGYDGVINYISNNITGGGFVDFSGDIVWRIEADGRPIKNFENIRNQKGTIQQPRQVSPIRIYSGQVITYVVNHVANGALAGNVICSCNGYYYPNKGA